MKSVPTLTLARTLELDQPLRSEIIQLCIDAHNLDDFRNLFSHLPADGLHVLALLSGQLLAHAEPILKSLASKPTVEDSMRVWAGKNGVVHWPEGPHKD